MNDKEFLIPIVAIFCVFGLPMIIGLVSILLKHQRSMAELIHQSRGVSQEQESEITALKEEIKQLKTALYEHSISVDDNVRAISQRLDGIEGHSRTKGV
jgi:predicted  nucleic acid-binding Zn-ribbon protein